MRQVVLVGAGYIAQVHAEALRSMPNVELYGVIDPNERVARAFAEKWGITRIFRSTAEAIQTGGIDCAHVLTPPATHAATALPFLEAGIATFLEKPLATNRAECEALLAEAATSNAVLGVNQNYVYYPAFLRLRRVLAERQLGGLRLVSCSYNMPLHQITNGQFGHWMFGHPASLLLEQAVHPLSQILCLAGAVTEVLSMPEAPITVLPGRSLHTSVSILARGRLAPAKLWFSVGESFPFWQVTAICDDGVAIADIAYNRFVMHRRTRWFDPFDHLVSGAGLGLSVLGGALRNAVDYAAATAKIKPRSDPFYQSIRASITAFHDALDRNKAPEIDGKFGADLVAICEEIARTIPASRPVPASVAKAGRYDILVLGGSGFIGRHVVARLLADGYRVGVMARNPHNLGAPFDSERVTLLQGDARTGADVEQAVSGARIVINLAHGGDSGPGIAGMIETAETVARACLAHGVERLIHAGSIAGLYLGPQSRPVTGSTPPDPHAERRSDYARGKAECDRLLMQLHATEGLPVCILRPGAVIGEGGVAAHGAVGFFNNDQHCIGWNPGRNPLPFVLVEDVADAIALACTAPGVVGRSYNLVGGVRLTAREYIAELARASGRPLRFHPKSPTSLWLQELGKWLIKRAAGRKAPIPKRYDLLARGLAAEFDCSDAERDLDWRPNRDREHFIERGIKVHTYRPEPP